MKTAKVLCITLIDNVYHCLTVHGKGSLHFGKDLSGRALFTDEPRVVASPDELNALCSRAAEIHISAPFPSAVYQLPQLPRVAKRYMPNLVSRNAQQTMGVEDPIHVRYMPVRDVTDGGVSKRETAYCAVLASEIQALWDTFEDHRSKIKSLVPLPVAIASMVSRLENPPDTFAVACTGKEDTILVIASPAGFVYVARSIPLTLPASRPATRTGEARIRETDADADTMDESLLDMDTSLAPQSVETPESRFSKELARELDMTVTFFKQEFRKPAPGRIYLLGESQIESIVHEHPLPPAYEEVHFGLDVESLRGLDRTFAAQNIRTLGNLFIPDAFNFVPAQEMARRRFSVALNAAVIVLAAGLGLAAFWSFDQSRSMALAKEEHARQLTRLQETQNRVAELEADVNRLKPVENWKQFYDAHHFFPGQGR